MLIQYHPSSLSSVLPSLLPYTSTYFRPFPFMSLKKKGGNLGIPGKLTHFPFLLHGINRVALLMFLNSNAVRQISGLQNVFLRKESLQSSLAASEDFTLFVLLPTLRWRPLSEVNSERRGILPRPKEKRGEAIAKKRERLRWTFGGDGKGEIEGGREEKSLGKKRRGEGTNKMPSLSFYTTNFFALSSLSLSGLRCIVRRSLLLFLLPNPSRGEEGDLFGGTTTRLSLLPTSSRDDDAKIGFLTMFSCPPALFSFFSEVFLRIPFFRIFWRWLSSDIVSIGKKKC